MRGRFMVDALRQPGAEIPIFLTRGGPNRNGQDEGIENPEFENRENAGVRLAPGMHARNRQGPLFDCLYVVLAM